MEKIRTKLPVIDGSRTLRREASGSNRIMADSRSYSPEYIQRFGGILNQITGKRYAIDMEKGRRKLERSLQFLQKP